MTKFRIVKITNNQVRGEFDTKKEARSFLRQHPERFLIIVEIEGE